MASASFTDDSRFGLRRQVRLSGPLRLDSGAALAPVDIAYETYGRMNADKSFSCSIRVHPRDPRREK